MRRTARESTATDWARGVPRRPFGRYVIALGLIAVTVIASTVLTSLSLQRQELDAGVIRTASHQIVLSQRISETAASISGVTNPAMVQTGADLVGQFASELQANHNGLMSGDSSRGLPGDNSRAVVNAFAVVQAHYEGMLIAAADLRAGVANEGVAPAGSFTRLVSAAELFETGMGGVVSAYESEAEDRVANLQITQYVLLSLTLLLLLAEGLLLFRPAAKHVKQAWRKRDADHKSAREDDQRRMTYLARFDPLTGLINRFLFGDRLQSAINRARREGGIVALMFLDLDEFKGVNDHYGHAVGDELLKQVAERLTDSVRASDTVARLGGDEFTVILEGSQRVEDAGQVATKIIRRLQDPFMVGPRQLRITASIGISLYPMDGDTAEELLRDADIAMYSAKTAGRNTYQYFTPELREQTTQRLALIDGLREALAAGDQLDLVYQPKFDAARGGVTGTEALIRWHHPRLGLIRPQRFIPVAEETDLIIPLGGWVLDKACEQAAKWRAEGLDLTMSVNVSNRQLRRGNLVEAVETALASHRLPPNSLELEITEATLMSDIDLARRTVERLRALGVGVSIDDFGTGYSSLSHLKRFPIDTLKIDRAFVRDLDTSEDAVALSSAIISLARSLDLDVVAEGVETREQLDTLARLGCTKMQGFLVSHPLRASDIPQFVTAGMAALIDDGIVPAHSGVGHDLGVAALRPASVSDGTATAL